MVLRMVLHWQRHDTLSTSGFMDDVMCSVHIRRLVDTAAATSLCLRAQANAHAASYWLRRVLDDGGRHRATDADHGRGEACNAPLP